MSQGTNYLEVIQTTDFENFIKNTSFAHLLECPALQSRNCHCIKELVMTKMWNGVDMKSYQITAEYLVIIQQNASKYLSLHNSRLDNMGTNDFASEVIFNVPEEWKSNGYFEYIKKTRKELLDHKICEEAIQKFLPYSNELMSSMLKTEAVNTNENPTDIETENDQGHLNNLSETQSIHSFHIEEYNDINLNSEPRSVVEPRQEGQRTFGTAPSANAGFEDRLFNREDDLGSVRSMETPRSGEKFNVSETNAVEQNTYHNTLQTNMINIETDAVLCSSLQTDIEAQPNNTCNQYINSIHSYQPIYTNAPSINLPNGNYSNTLAPTTQGQHMDHPVNIPTILNTTSQPMFDAMPNHQIHVMNPNVYANGPPPNIHNEDFRTAPRPANNNIMFVPAIPYVITNGPRSNMHNGDFRTAPRHGPK
ncbi:hypothetical protein RF11_15077 [Thelohanellus kitauei]|uniref:Uncharacterized protein n=1 Tax=Thelohanellus kitauei TaxID=669202 RepID=A0A0C2J193_THEKT|nr:hypothetical protein RF11_15077 [Thelohanellus kitauei]